MRRMSRSSVRTTSAPRVGAESRPSRKPWMAMAGTRCRTPSSTQASRCRSSACTPPGPRRPTRWSVPPRLPQAGAQLHQRRKLVELAGLDALGDADQILGDHPAGPEVQVADLAVPHLAFGETHRQPARLEQGARKAFPEPVPDGGGGQLDGVALPFRAGTPSRPAPPGQPGSGDVRLTWLSACSTMPDCELRAAI